MQIGIVWKHSGDGDVCSRDNAGDGVPNLLTRNWIPQNDLLSDGRVRLLVTHGGVNSIVEAAFHGKPLVVVPLSLDQPANAAAVVQRGFAERVELSDPDFAESLRRAVGRVLNDRSYADEARHAARLFAEQHDDVGARMSAAIGAVVRHGTKHVRSVGAFRLNIYQFLMIDVFLALAAGAAFAFCCLFVIVRKLLCKICCRRAGARVTATGGDMSSGKKVN